MSSTSKLAEHRALVLDVYGTLVDWEFAIHDALLPVFPHLAREHILANYAVAEGSLQKQFPSTQYAQILEMAYRQLVAPTSDPGPTSAAVASKGELELRSAPRHASTSSVKANEISTTVPPPILDDAQRFAASIRDWRPFPDTVDALHRLKKHFALVVLSNVDDDSFARTHAALCTPEYPGSAYRTITPDSPFSLVLTAQQIGAYKPNPAMLASALKQLSADPDPSLPSNPSVRAVGASDVLVVAISIRHDIIPAEQQNLRSVWISRHGVNLIGNESTVAVHHADREGPTRDPRCPYAWRYETLGRMADAVEREFGKVQKDEGVV